MRSAISRNWAILTGEYPPQQGGVSDYTRLLADELARTGDQVHAWTPPVSAHEMPAGRVDLRRLPDQFGDKSRRVLNSAIRQLPADARLVVQYVPQAFGWRGMNVPFCFWLWKQRRRCHIDVMFHEVATPWGKGAGLRQVRRHILAAVTRIMAFLVAHAANRIYGSIPAWEGMLRRLAIRKPFRWLPVPSTIPIEADPPSVAKVREALLRTCRTKFLVGHFGTFGVHIATGLEAVLPELLAAEPEVAIVLIGRGSAEFVGAFSRRHPAAGDRLMGTGSLPARAVSEHLAACDVLLQPYVDGVSSRRTSMMAGLALGRPIVTTVGCLSEPIWRESRAVRLVNSFAEMSNAVIALIADPAERERLSEASIAFYHKQFQISLTIEVLRSNSHCTLSCA